jgi:hypothetical protein
VIVCAEAPVSRISEAFEKLALLVVPVVLKSVPFLSAAEPVTSKLAPKTVLPPLTVNVFVPATVVSPFIVLVPEPVLNVPEPFWVKFLPVAIVTSPFRLFAPDPVLNVPVPLCVKFLFAAIVVSPFSETAPEPVEKVPAAVLGKGFVCRNLRITV